jgi:16S rRNA (cytosine967-C5)-methyltransferase
MSRARRPTLKIGPRALCVHVLHEVVGRRRYLDRALDEALAARDDAALIQEMAYGTLRWYHQLDAIVAQLLQKPLKQKDDDLHLSLLLGLYQLRYMRVAPHAAVDQTVEAVTALGKPWAKGLINACLRAYLRDQEQGGARADGIVTRNPVARFSHPAWLIEALRQDHPAQWEEILTANNEHPPMSLRVNLRRQSRADYLEKLRAAGVGARALENCESAVVLETPMAVTTLPGFAAGEVSVQDAGAQIAAALLDAAPQARVLDACAAPGGKSAHLLERHPAIELTALEVDAERVPLIEQNLQRLGLGAIVRTADAATPGEWWDGRPFDCILADVPCSATGVIRRHPDIKLRRQPAELDQLVRTQARILDGLWPTLRPGGKLLYTTCSVLTRENEQQVNAFLARHADAVEQPLAHPVAVAREHGMQFLPGRETMDGFFYACLAKRSE